VQSVSAACTGIFFQILSKLLNFAKNCCHNDQEMKFKQYKDCGIVTLTLRAFVDIIYNEGKSPFLAIL
jgi:hypothetical protein